MPNLDALTLPLHEYYRVFHWDKALYACYQQSSTRLYGDHRVGVFASYGEAHAACEALRAHLWTIRRFKGIDSPRLQA